MTNDIPIDRRLTPANSHIAHESLRDLIEAPQYTTGIWRRVGLGVANLLRAPGGARDRQVLYGERLLQLEARDGYAFVQAEKDGYVGYLALDTLQADGAATHWVSAPGTHLYPQADFKQPEVMELSFGARVQVKTQDGRFAETDAGLFVPSAHLSPLSDPKPDIVATAALFLGTPYLWGGNGHAGIDCSGLIQAALIAAGHTCPGDSDLQEASLGRDIPDDTALQPGDLLFWRGHVAMVASDTQIIHANAHHMAVVYENTEDAIARIQDQGDGPVTSRKRI